jgi:hypothetical protein
LSFTFVTFFTEQKCTWDAARDAVIPARDRDVDVMCASARHGWVSWCGWQNLPELRVGVNLQCVSLPFTTRVPISPPSGGCLPQRATKVNGGLQSSLFGSATVQVLDSGPRDARYGIG